MTPERFNEVVETAFGTCKAILQTKEQEYSAGRDRLDQFKIGKLLTDLPPHQVLRGMMLKHTTSIYDMLKANSVIEYSLAKWEEKIFDHINYLVLLYGIVCEKVDISPPQEKLENIKLEPDALVHTHSDHATRKGPTSFYPKPLSGLLKDDF